MLLDAEGDGEDDVAFLSGIEIFKFFPFMNFVLFWLESRNYKWNTCEAFFFRECLKYLGYFCQQN